jgi:hypothetical protein
LTALESPNGSPQWQGFGDTSKQVIVVPTSDVPEGYVMLGPVTCDDNGSLTTAWAPSIACPDNLTGATWDAKGRPSATNPPGFQHPLAVHPVIHSWDGKLLGSFEVTIDYSTT